MKLFDTLFIIAVTLQLCFTAPLMLEARSDFIESLTKSSIAVFYYGLQDTPEYAAFQSILPSDRQLFSDLEFYFIPSSTIKLSKKQKSLFLYRNIQGNEWLTYDGPFDVKMMSDWVRHNCIDSLPEVKGDQIDDMLIKRQSGFILLDMGKFQLLASKILINDYCHKNKLKCRKCTLNNEALRVVVQLMEADDEYGVSKLAFWDAKTSKFEIFNKAPLHQLKQEHLIEMHQGKEGLVKAGVTPTSPEEQPVVDEIPQTEDL